MLLAAGDKLGPYEILAPIGAGGMGEVYKARDTRLDRIVAIKTSHKQFNERFEREALAIAALNHPHICSLYDVGQGFLVMEYVEGTPLKGPLPIDQALKLAVQILDALDTAHRKGITHRDLKPGNILVTKSGVKLLDFGLAKTSHAPGPQDDTITALTSDGAVLGTLQYMSPEQLEGKEADARSDIFAFGLVFFEMIAGRRAFPGTTRAGLIASILKDQPPPLSTLQPLIPKALDRVVGTCLEKNPDDRWQSARELKHALMWTMAETPATTAPTSAVRSWLWSAVAVLLAIALGVAAWALWPRPAPARVARFEVGLPENVSPSLYISLSPDGRKLVFNAEGEQAGLWIHNLDELTWRRLPDTQGAKSPFWAPDSRYLAFSVQNQLKKIDTSGGLPQTLCELAWQVGSGSWSRDGVIIVGSLANGTIQQVSQAGGVPTEVTSIDAARGETFHALPTFLPDGKHFLYLRQGSDQVRGMYVGNLDVKPAEQSKERMLASQYAATYVDGYLFFMRENALMAQRFDAGRLQLQGEPLRVVEYVETSQSIGMFSVSPSGALAYRSTNSDKNYQLTWFDRRGKAQGNFGPPGPARGIALSPDGTRVAVRDAASQAQGDIWLIDLVRGVPARLTFRHSAGSFPVWSADGSRITFSAGTTFLDTVYEKASSGTGDDKELFNRAGESTHPTSWSHDGRFLLYYTVNAPKTGVDMWVLPMEGDRKPVLLLGTQFDEGNAVFSPDMRWIAYQSNESGRNEVYVRPFLASGPSGAPALGERKIPISKDGGTEPKWPGDGKEIIFQAPPRGTSKMAVETKANGAAFGVPQRLFTAPLDYGWDVTADGKRFLLAVLPTGQPSAVTPITVLLNWQAELKK
jgi:serine/threonine protein kinase